VAAAGNRAVTSLLTARTPPAWASGVVVRALQRAPATAGWKGAKGWNAGVKDEAGVNRVPLDGLTLGNQQAFSGDHTNRDGTVEHGGANEKAKTGESAAGRAVVLVPKGVSDKAPVTVLLHLHGYTSRTWDPYAGWRQRTDGTVRDVALDRLEAQINAAGDPQVVGILPQGVGHSEFGKMDPNAYVDEVLKKLASVGPAEKIPLPDPAKGFRLILSAHSGGGHTVKNVLQAEGKPGAAAPAEVVLFEAINNAGEQKAVTDWAVGHLDRTLAAVAKAGDDAGKDAAVAACPVLRAYRSRKNGIYATTYDGLKASLDGWFADPAHQSALGGRLAPLRDRFRVTVLQGTADHEQVVRGIGNDPAAGPMADALSAYRNPSKPSTLDVGTAPATTKPSKKKKAKRKTAAITPAPGTTGPQGDTAPTTGAPATTGGDFTHDLARTTLELLPEAERSRFAGIDWVALDYPGAKLKIKDTSEENVAKWRATPGYEVFDVTEKTGPAPYLRGTHQAQAQQLLDALARVRPGGGERRPNQGKTALLTSKQYKQDPAKYDEYISSQLADVTSYGETDPRRTGTQTHQLNKHAAGQFAKALAAAAAEDVHLSINNSFRTRAKAAAGAKRAGNAKAVAKYSAHSMGLAVDLNLWVAGLGKRGDVSTAMTNVVKLLSTPGYKWMYQHGAQFGFYQYRNEPWHWEYNPPGFADTFWAEAADLAPAPEPEPVKRSRAKK
jgi:LAS superfamily LD-carboxypeptidase LdcB